VTAPDLVDRGLWRRRRGELADCRGHALFAGLVDSLLDRLAAVRRRFERVLVIGAAPGMAPRLRGAFPDSLVVLADGSEALLRPSAADGPALALDEEALPFAVGSLDLVIGALTLHWTNDLVGALAQIRIALKPDGLFLGALFGGRTLCELRDGLAEAEVERAGGLGLRVAPMADIRDVGGVLQRAGFALPVVDSERFAIEYGNLRELMRDLRRIGESNVLASRGGPLRRDVLTAAERALQRRQHCSAGVRSSFEVLHLCGWAPHESQPKPLRPGSAAVRLADSLGVAELSAGEAAGPPSLSAVQGGIFTGRGEG